MTDPSAFVVVTGGAGFIGSHTVDRLAARGCRVVILDNLSTGRRSNVASLLEDGRVELVEANIADGLFAPLAPLTDRWGPVEHIVHLAAQTAVTRSVFNPLDDVRVNLGGTVQVLEYARCRHVRTVVYASSSAVYGDDATQPTDEEQPTRPMSPYGIDKLSGEHFLRYYGAVHGVAATAFRFFNVYGPRQDPGSPYSGVISIFAKRALAGEPLTIFGDGGQTRDFVYVGDVADAVVDATLGDRAVGAVLNIGTGRSTTINDLAAIIGEQAGSVSSVVHAPPRAGDIYHSLAAIHRARAALDFRPGTSLRSGLAATLAWMRASSP
jgi:UDP-glucose 4-epimerase